MTQILLDTHTWAWSLRRPDYLSDKAKKAIAGATVLVSPISIYEIGQKVRIGKWPEMMPAIDNLERYLDEQGGEIAPLTPEIAHKAALLDWPHRDPFDRMLAATAIVMGLQIVSKDPCFDTLTVEVGAVARVW